MSKIVEDQVVVVTRGCKARDIQKGSRGQVITVTEMGAEYGHNVKVVLGFGVRKVVFFARHVNRLSDEVVRLNDGNPLHVIEVRCDKCEAIHKGVQSPGGREMSKKIQVTGFTREDGLKLHGGPLGWIITLTGYGPTWVYKDQWVLVTSPEARTVDNTYYPTLEEAMDIFETVELPQLVKG